MASTTARMEVFKSTVSSRSGDYKLEVNLTKVNRGELLSLENPQYEQLMKKYPHLKSVEMDDTDTKSLLPVHVILIAGVCVRIKTDTRPQVGNQGEPVAERTKLGWVILSLGEEIDTAHMHACSLHKPAKWITRNCAGWMCWVLLTPHNMIKVKCTGNFESSCTAAKVDGMKQLYHGRAITHRSLQTSREVYVD